MTGQPLDPQATSADANAWLRRRGRPSAPPEDPYEAARERIAAAQGDPLASLRPTGHTVDAQIRAAANPRPTLSDTDAHKAVSRARGKGQIN